MTFVARPPLVKSSGRKNNSKLSILERCETSPEDQSTADLTAGVQQVFGVGPELTGEQAEQEGDNLCSVLGSDMGDLLS